MNEKENHLPNLSDKERAHALELAMKARKRRAVLKARMKSGELAFTDALNEEDAKRIEVVSLLKCVPGIGASKAEAIRRLVKIPLGRRVSGLGIRQREELTALEKKRLENDSTEVKSFVMYPRWTHWRDLKGTCPICGEPAHVGTSKRTGRHFWLHDKYDMYEYYNGHGIHGL